MGLIRTSTALVAATTLSFLASSCGERSTNSTTDLSLIGTQVGEIMASIDEMGGSTGTLGSMNRYFMEVDRQLSRPRLFPDLIPEARAETCALSATFQPCTVINRTTIRNFSGCTIGSSSLRGSVTLKWAGSGTGCSLTPPVADSSKITRTPNFTVTSSSGAILTAMLAPGAVYGHQITYKSGSGSSAVYNFNTDGVRTALVDSAGFTRADLTLSTVSDLVITGSARVPRVLSGGTLRVYNNLNDVSCDFSPSSVTWAGSCSCPVSGTWNATCSNGPGVTLTLTGCGTATLTSSGISQNLTFDRCYGI